MKKTIFMLLIIPVLVFSKDHSTVIENPFSIAYGGQGTNIYGDYTSIASSIECIKNTDGSCNNDYNGNLYDATTKYLNSVATTAIPLNSSTETLSLPSDINGTDIVYAGLFWQGHIAGTDAGDYSTGIVGRNVVTMQDSSGTLHTLTADKVWYHDFWGDGTGYDGGYRSFYQGYKDVTTILQTSYTKSQTNNYTVGNIKASVGFDNYQYFWTTDSEYNGIRMGFYGNWNLVVVYRHPNIAILSPRPKAKNITIFHGFDALVPLPTTTASRTKSINLDLSGFLTPASTPISARLLFYGSGGEKSLHYDSLEIQDKKTTGYIDLSNTANPVDDAFNGTVSNLGVPIDSNITYYPGLDSDSFDVSSAMDTKQTTTSLRLTARFINNSGDQFFPGLIAFSTDLYEPEFCYDYAYKQQDKYFTEDNNGTQNPKIYGTDIQIHEPIEVTMYIRNLVESDIDITNMYASVSDINTSFASYINDSTKLAKIGNLTPEPIPDSSFTVGSDANGDYIKNISVGNVKANEYFYLYYSIDPLKPTIDMPIKMQVTYDLTTDGTTIPYTLTVGSNLKMCSTSNFEYRPAKGIFNIVHNDYYDYDIGGSKRYYNLPTQVTKREGNFKVLSMDPDNLDDLKGVSTTVAVEMIDASAFHDTNASCSELSSSISERIWVEFDTNTSSTLFDKDAINAAIGYNNTITSAAEFYANARQNAAFRISYPISNDANGSLVQLSDADANGYKKIENYPEIVQVVGACSHPVKYPLGVSGNIGIATTAAQACGNSGTYISPQQIQSCMECIYGYNTKLVCSRDNFSIRPEALMIKLDDQNQTNPTVQTRIDDTISGLAIPIPKVLHLSSGYQYNIELNATNHINNVASAGYTKTYNIDNSSVASYIFEPRSITTANANLFCNDTNDTNITLRFLNGVVDTNTSMDQVGEYRLKLRDTSWTTVDSDTATMSHHTVPYFTANADCYSNSSITQNVNAAMNPNDITTLNGCNISSNHINNEANLKYNDYNVTFHPYKFDLNATNGGNPITPTIGLLFTPVPNTTPYIYISDINTSLDENMSYHLNGSISALGENNVTLTNFVDKCYATPLDINISTSDRDLNDSNGNHVDYRVRFHDINSSNKVITALDINVTDDNTTSHTNDILIQTVQTSTKGYFPKNLNGTMQTRLNMNYVREKDTTINPTTLTFIKYQVNCTNAAADCTLNADLINNKTTKGAKDLNATLPIRHYYGRTHAPRQTISGSDGNISMYYEVFCSGATCNKALLQDGIDSNTTDDPRWFMNTKHSNEAGTAAQTTTKQKNAANVTITREANANHPDYIGLHYNENSGYPYKATMENNASGWLIYNKYNANSITNEFQVEFIKPGGDWAGVHETNATTNKNASENTNRRLMW
ncbi:hypothetical protein [Sulfurimonas autotrophica]|uniref:Uncharacterized protein n=1 Tax=Sulfurimonas autotrophica (strain ATCC BAA-671 / DSM 16294 / JCM 11897 / OK10) TaxID=563040 RepID=E0UQ99_SULAO|nr:hypothetical protein [Sulfurimonas autotrophica]ADN09842.1 hypothetical protein Saut_1798 [Sulfurimonas autotrophica DSM 16294]